MKDKWIAIPLAFFLGGLGIHRFYLGQTLFGFIYLIFCWTFIPSIIGLVDAIVWFFQSDNAFNENYNGFKSK